MAIVRKERIPSAITGAILAAFTVFLAIPNVLNAPFALNFGAWGVFIGWAAYFAAGGTGPGSTVKTMKKIYPCMIWGSFWGFVAGLVFANYNSSFSDTTSMLLFDFLIIFLVNQPILWGAKYWKLVSYAPASFFGFATFFATFFGGFGLEPGAVAVAWLSGLLMNLLGPIWAHMQVLFTASHDVEVPDKPTEAKT
jgi:hypothetical protein